MKISQRVSELLSGHDFYSEVFKWDNSVKTVLMVLVLCMSFDDALYLHQVS